MSVYLVDKVRIDFIVLIVDVSKIDPWLLCSKHVCFRQDYVGCDFDGGVTSSVGIVTSIVLHEGLCSDTQIQNSSFNSSLQVWWAKTKTLGPYMCLKMVKLRFELKLVLIDIDLESIYKLGIGLNMKFNTNRKHVEWKPHHF